MNFHDPKGRIQLDGINSETSTSLLLDVTPQTILARRPLRTSPRPLRNVTSRMEVLRLTFSASLFDSDSWVHEREPEFVSSSCMLLALKLARRNCGPSRSKMSVVFGQYCVSETFVYLDLAGNTFDLCFAFRFSPNMSTEMCELVHSFRFNPFHRQVVVHGLVLETSLRIFIVLSWILP